MGNQRSVLCNANPNVRDDPDIVITELLLLREGCRKEVYRGTLSDPVEGKPFVVCKVAYGQNAMAVLKREAEPYQDKLKQLQGVRVPTCFGYFIGDTDEGLITGCLALDYCGEPVETCFEDLDLELRIDGINAFVDLHDAGISHNDVSERKVLNCLGSPIIVDFEDATEKECERKMKVEINAIEPHPYNFGCKELHRLCNELNLWKPSSVIYGRGYQSVKLLADSHRLAATAPKNWSPERALKEAYQVIAEHTKEYCPENYFEWLATQSTSPCLEILTLLIPMISGSNGVPPEFLPSKIFDPKASNDNSSEPSEESDRPEDSSVKGAAQLIVFV